MAKKTKSTNRAAVLLARHLNGRPLRELALELGCSISTASRLCLGQQKANRKQAIVCFRVAKIPLTAWDDPA